MPKVVAPITDTEAAVPRSAILGAVLTGLSTATSAVIAATDTVLQALGKLQAQISANNATSTAIQGAFLVSSDGTPLVTSAGDFITTSAA
jgi:hypothetical protein